MVVSSAGGHQLEQEVRTILVSFSCFFPNALGGRGSAAGINFLSQTIQQPLWFLKKKKKVSLTNKTLTLTFCRIVVGYPFTVVSLNASGTSFSSILPEKAEKALSHQGDAFMNSNFFPDPRSGEGSVEW